MATSYYLFVSLVNTNTNIGIYIMRCYTNIMILLIWDGILPYV